MENIVEMKIVRYEEQPLRCFGRMYINGNYVCDTLEDTDRHLEDYLDNIELGKKKKIYGKTAIPLGTYPIKYELWAKHNNYYPWVKNVPFFSGILIHGGVTENHSLGCILVGKRKDNILTQSSFHLNKIRTYFSEIKSGILTIERNLENNDQK